MGKTKIIHVAVEPVMAKKLEKYAKTVDASVSAVIRTALREFLASSEPTP